jgi:putative hydrolase of the HAD superfamily
MPINAILFDLDNTIYPASAGLMHALDSRILAYMQERLGVTTEAALEIRREYFTTYGTTLRGLQLHDQVDPEEFLARVHDLRFEAFLDSDAELDHLLGQLHATKAIFTNSPIEHAHGVLKTLGIDRHFQQIFDIRFQEFLPKPDRRGYQRALEQLGVPGTQACMVEDTLKNLTTARQLGMLTIYISEETPEHEHPADYVVPDIHTALRILLELQGQR